MIQGGQGEALSRQGAEKAKVMEGGTVGATSQAGHLVVSSRKLRRQVGPGVEEAIQGKPHLTRSGRNNKRRRSQQDSSWFFTCLSLNLSQDSRLLCHRLPCTAEW